MNSPVTIIPEDSCWGYLASQEVGRLGVSSHDVPEIFPINYVVDADTLVFRSAEGSKLLAATIGGKAAFEVDRWDAASGISVVAHGTLRELDDPDEIAYAAALPLRPWVGTIKAHFLCLTVTEITGRTFTFGDAPEDFAQLG